ncbi:RxLR effector protein [Phytophthora megakarya]|uniref:RxLR effector protein n=1 Tax=Phytophthora megakarya TaxID=4795 RepID=A0A225VHS2_9STRA|nr:RxLR effector protein [Phytophthora megakarya]
MFHTLTNQYGKEGLKVLIANAKKSKDTETIALKLQQEIWRSEGKTADDVFKLLKMNYNGDIFLRAPISYASLLNNVNLDYCMRNEFGAITELEKHFPYIKLARMVGATM